MKKQLCEADQEICDMKSQIDMLVNTIEEKDSEIENFSNKLDH